jgi:hypothetical protein
MEDMKLDLSTLFELDISKFLEEIWKYLIIAVVVPLLSPILRTIDVNRRKADIRRELESIKLMMEIESLIYDGNNNERIEHYKNEYEKIAQQRSCNSYEKTKRKSNEVDHYPFDTGSVIASLIIPVAIFFGVIYSNDVFTEQVIMSIPPVTAGIMSFLVAKLIICKKIKSDILQKTFVTLFSILAIFAMGALTILVAKTFFGK